MTHFRHNLRDLEFNLFEVFGADKTLDNPAFSDLDEATAREILAELARLSGSRFTPEAYCLARSRLPVSVLRALLGKLITLCPQASAAAPAR